MIDGNTVHLQGINAVRKSDVDDEDLLVNEMFPLYAGMFTAEVQGRDPDFPNKGTVWHIRRREGESKYHLL